MTTRPTLAGAIALGWCVATCACQMISGVDDLVVAKDATSGVAGADGAAADAGCDPTRAFSDPILVPNINDGLNAVRPWLSADQKTLYFSIRNAGQFDLYRAAIDATSTPSAVTSLQSLNSDKSELGSTVTDDELTIYFQTDRVTSGKDQIYVATRAPGATEFDPPSPVAGVNDPSPTVTDGFPAVTGDGRLLYFRSSRDAVDGGKKMGIYVFKFDANAPAPVSELDTSDYDSFPAVSSDGRAIYFASSRSGAGEQGGIDIWMADRVSRDEPFGPAKNVSEVNSSLDDFPGWISPDGCTLYFHRSDGTLFQVFVARRGP